MSRSVVMSYSYLIFSCGVNSSNFRGIKQEAEDFVLQSYGAVREVFNIVEDIAEVLKDRCFGCKRPVAVGQFQEDVLDAVRHQFEGLPFPELVSVEHLIGILMEGEVHDADEVNGRKVEGALPGGQLHLHDKAGAVGVGAFHIDPDPLAVWKRVDVLLRSILERNDRAFGNEFPEKEGKKSAGPRTYKTRLCAEISSGGAFPCTNQVEMGRIAGFRWRFVQENLIPCPFNCTNEICTWGLARGPAWTGPL